jgi:hypothetical protein
LASIYLESEFTHVHRNSGIRNIKKCYSNDSLDLCHHLFSIGINVSALVAIASTNDPDLAPLVAPLITVNIAVGCSASLIVWEILNQYPEANLAFYYFNLTTEYCINGMLYQLPTGVFIANYTY